MRHYGAPPGSHHATITSDTRLSHEIMDERIPHWRGIFSFDDEESPEWKEVLQRHQGIPKFRTKEECDDFLRSYCTRGSNPRYPYLQHIFSFLVDQDQIDKILLPKIKHYDTQYPFQPPKPLPSSNRFYANAVTEGIDDRLNLTFHQRLSRESTKNMLKYLFYHMRCGVYVMIRDRKLVLFVPFANKDYENNWGHRIIFDSPDKTMEAYYEEKRQFYRSENIIPNTNHWWANGNIICNEHSKPHAIESETQYWGDQFLPQLRDMLEESCRHREIPDCEFFINKRDYPHLKSNLTEPYGFLFDRDDNDPSQDIPLSGHQYATYAPIMSFYTSKRFADIPFPCSEDWEAATGCVFPPSFRHSHCPKCPCQDRHACLNNWECFCAEKRHGVEKPRDLFSADNFNNFYKSWDEKINTAFFRGNSTGGGTSIDTNQRLHLAHVCNLWKKTKAGDALALLDAEVTGWNLRDKKVASNPKMTFLRCDQFQFTAGRHHYIPIYDQSKYKYLLYIEGHCAANRYAFLMRLGSVILKVESTCVASEMWYFPLLEPFVDHVPIRADLSDLEEKIQWCRENDAKCQAIAQSAKDKYDTYVSKDAIYDYMQLVTTKIAERFVPDPVWYSPPQDPLPNPVDRCPTSKCIVGRNEPSKYCRRCDELIEAELDEEAEEDLDYDEDVKPLSSSSTSISSSKPTPSSFKRRKSEPQCKRCRRAITRCKCA